MNLQGQDWEQVGAPSKVWFCYCFWTLPCAWRRGRLGNSERPATAARPLHAQVVIRKKPEKSAVANSSKAVSEAIRGTMNL